MKTVVVALLVLLVISQGESLKCKCGGPARPCQSPVETCPASQPFCGNVIIPSAAPGYFYQGCMEPRECRGLDNPGISTTTCCTTDLCNAFDGIRSTV
ncbi:lymphocyte antigen 6D-like [Labrus mixtus]|uniref:lymphocyte antigen 6D-like n=1 Tax=Labrus mixtus TaxID=508554 RepID=UPI0029C09E50|nr:lymphocyte antigen 6D-like [Labrus mixtus]